MKVKGEPLREASQILGEAPETEFMFLVLPASTYRLISDQAAKEGCTAAQVFQTALLQYLRNADQAKKEPVSEQRPRIQPALVVRRRKS